MLAAVDSSSDAAAAELLPQNTALQELSEHINAKHRAAQYAQRDSQQLFQTLFFTDKADDDDVCVVNAVVFDVRSNGLMVFVPRSVAQLYVGVCVSVNCSLFENYCCFK